VTEGRRKLEAVGDALLLAIARLYLKERHPDIPYKHYTRLTSRMVCNERLTELAAREGITGEEGEKLAAAFEISIACRLYVDGFAGCRTWLWQVFDRHMDMEAEVRRITEPPADEQLEKQVRGALKQVLASQNGRITDIQKAARIVIASLRNSDSL
jgi:dsRNA-specific ribonuclease